MEAEKIYMISKWGWGGDAVAKGEETKESESLSSSLNQGLNTVSCH